MIRDVNKKLLKLSGNRLIRLMSLPRIDFISNTDDGIFKNRVGSTPMLTVTNNYTGRISNTMYIDWGGEEILSYDFTNSYQINEGRSLIVKKGKKLTVWFKYPQNITSISIYAMQVTGEFPVGLSLYNLSSLSITGGNYLSFPLDYGSVKYDRLLITSITENILTEIPKWILSSEIRYLTLGGGFDISNTDVQDEIFSIKGLVNFSAQPSIRFTDLSPNFKNHTNILYLGLGTTFESIPESVTAAKHLKGLSIGYSPISSIIGQGQIANSYLTDWGTGLYGMINLEIFGVGGSNEAPITIPPGLEDCINLRTLIIVGCYRNENRLFNYLNNLISFLEINTTIKNLTIYNARVSSLAGHPYNYRGFGNYQDSDKLTTSMECYYRLVKTFNCTIYITNIDDSGTEILAP